MACAIVTNWGNLIKWTTPNQKDISHYEVYRRVDAVTASITTADVVAKRYHITNTETPSVFHYDLFSSLNTSTSYWYWVKSVAFDGQRSTGPHPTITADRSTLPTLINSSSNITFDGNIIICGSLTVNNTATISALTVAGPASVGTTLHVCGATTLGDTLTVSGATTINNSLTASSLNITANVSVQNTLHVSGVATFGDTLTTSGNVSINANLGVTGTATFDGATVINDTLTVSGAVSLSTTLHVCGATTLGSTLSVSSEATFNDGVTIYSATQVKDFIAMTALAVNPAAADGIRLFGKATAGLTKLMYIDSASTVYQLPGAAAAGNDVYVEEKATAITDSTGSDLYLNFNTNLVVTTATGSCATISLDPNPVVDSLTTSGNLTVGGNAVVCGTLTVSGATSLDGATTINDNLVVSGTTSLGGAVTMSGGATINGGAVVSGGFTVTGTSSLDGATTINGSLTVSGASTLQGAVTISGGLTANEITVTGDLTMCGTLTVNGTAITNPDPLNTVYNGSSISTSDLEFNTASFSVVTGTGTCATISIAPDLVLDSLTVSGNTTIGGNLTVCGNTTLSGSLTVDGLVTATGVNVSTMLVSGTLTVCGQTTLGSDLTVSGVTSLGGNVTVCGTLTVSGTTTVYGQLNVDQACFICGSVTINGNNLTVASNAAFNGTTNAFTGAVSIGGQLVCSGTATFTNKTTFDDTVCCAATMYTRSFIPIADDTYAFGAAIGNKYATMFTYNITGTNDGISLSGTTCIIGPGGSFPAEVPAYLSVGDASTPVSTNIIRANTIYTNTGNNVGVYCLNQCAPTATPASSVDHMGVDGFVQLNNTDCTGNYYGLRFGPYVSFATGGRNDASNLTKTYGIQTWAMGGYLANFNAYEARGFHVKILRNDLNTDFCATTTYGIHIDSSDSPGGNGSITTAYGLRIEDQTPATTNYQAVMAGNTYARCGLWLGGTSGSHLVRTSSGFHITGLRNASNSNYVRYITTSGELTYASSSRRFKENIIPFQDDWEKVLELEPIEFNYKTETPDKKAIGYIAEDLDEKGLNRLVTYDTEGLPESIDYPLLVLYLKEIVLKQQKRLDDMEETIKDLTHNNK